MLGAVGGKKCEIITDGSLSFRIVLLGEAMCTLIFEIGCEISMSNTSTTIEYNCNDALSHATVSRMIQEGFLMYEVTRPSTREMSLEFPRELLTLAIKPRPHPRRIKLQKRQLTGYTPGRSQKDRSATSGPLI
jgi:hypothetical protein